MPDKLKHFLVNLLIIIAIGYFNLLLAVIIALLFSLGKEVYDKYIKITFFDYRDILADGIGIMAGLGVLRIIT